MPNPKYSLKAMGILRMGDACSLVETANRSAPSNSIASVTKSLALSCAFAALLSIGAPQIVPSAHAQVAGDALFGEVETNPNAQMLLEADELIYDDVNNSVAAVGNVQIAYDKYTLVAERVTYERATGRVIARGGVEIVEPNGNRVFAEEIDITDDFQDGFVAALRVETAENTRFAAESAERRDGQIAVFNNGVYTACEVCKENPEKPPLWQIRAKRVIINNVTKTVSYEGAAFELFGAPIAYAPRFSHALPGEKRKSGFIFETPRNSDELGFSAGASYFWALAPNYDLTVGGRYYTQQGFLAKAEWRHRTVNGQYDVRFAGIDQQGIDEFDATEIDANETERGAVMSTGKFDLNPRWKFGWNVLAQTDGNFARTYDLENFTNREITNEVYLTGLNDKNFFDLRAKQYLIQDHRLNQITIKDLDILPAAARPDLYAGNDLRQDQQGKALPVFDYNIVSDRPVNGGQVSLDVNVTNIKRSKVDIVNYDTGVGLTDTNE
ncbi:MAG: LPS assembly protein LptD, partial [Salaquimonas sp.]